MGSSGALKAIGGISAASVTAIATGVGIDQNNKHQKALEEEKVRQQELAKKRAIEEEKQQRILAEQRVIQAAVKNIKESVVGKSNWFGGGLYEFLEDQDIVFKLSKVPKEGELTELTKENFQLTPPQTLTIKVSVLISKDSEQLKISDSEREKIEHLKALNGGNDWTWSCHVKFETSVAQDQKNPDYRLKDEDKLLNDKDGFFDVLKKDLTQESDGTDKAKWKGIKKGFVENCSDFAKKNNKSESSLETLRPTFSLWKKENETGKLYFTNSFTTSEDAKKWFGNEITVIGMTSS